MIEINPTIKNIEFYHLHSVLIFKYRNPNWQGLPVIFDRVNFKGAVFEYKSTHLIDSEEDVYIDILIAESEF